MPRETGRREWPESPRIWIEFYSSFFISYGQIAQLVEQRTENPRVGGSIPLLATIPLALNSTALSAAQDLKIRFSVLVLGQICGALKTRVRLHGCRR
jgi:hypothetical protein